MYYWVRYQREHQCTLTMCLFTQWSLLCYFYPPSVKRYDQFNITVFSVWLIKNSESENIKFLTIKSLFISSANDDHSLIIWDYRFFQRWTFQKVPPYFWYDMVYCWSKMVMSTSTPKTAQDFHRCGTQGGRLGCSTHPTTVPRTSLFQQTVCEFL